MTDEWKITFVNSNAEAEVLALSPDLQAKLLHIVELIQEFGPHRIGLPHIRPLTRKMWELRLKGKSNIARSIYVFSSGKRLVILHTFIKKTQQTPSKAIKIAEARMKEVNND